jgi:hypothetical protein
MYDRSSTDQPLASGQAPQKISLQNTCRISISSINNVAVGLINDHDLPCRLTLSDLNSLATRSNMPGRQAPA